MMFRWCVLFAICVCLGSIIDCTNADVLDIDSSNNVTKCDLCIDAVKAFKAILTWKPVENCIKPFAVKICEIFNIEDNNVCKGIVNVYAAQYLYMFSELVLDEDAVCHALLQHECPTPAPKNNTWSVTIDPVKPPVENWPAPDPSLHKYRVLHLGDIHWDPWYAIGAPTICVEPLCCRDGVKGNSSTVPKSGYWGSSSLICDLPFMTFENMLMQIRQQEPQIDYIIFTGDLAPHDVWLYTREKHLSMITNLTTLVAQHFPGVPFYWAMGNHESVPCDLTPAFGQSDQFNMGWLYDHFWDTWRSVDYTQKDSVRQRASFVAKPFPGWRVISLNDVYSDGTNYWRYLYEEDPDGTLQWLSDELHAAEQAGDKVHLIFHIPNGHCSIDQWSQLVYDMVNRYESTIRVISNGHTHKDEFSVFYSGDQATDRVTAFSIIAPSVDARLNPAYKIYSIENETFILSDLKTYYGDIEVANKEQKAPKYILEYDQKEAYQMASLAPTEWGKLANRFDKNMTLFADTYMKFAFRGNVACDAGCQRDFLCRIHSSLSAKNHYCDHIPPKSVKEPQPSASFSELYVISQQLNALIESLKFGCNK